MLQGGCREQSVNDGERSPSPLGLSSKRPPRICNWLIDRQNSAFEPFRQVMVKPLLQPCAPLTRRKKLDSQADFSKGEDAGVKGIGVGCFQPLFHVSVWFASSIELGKHIRIEQESTHNSMVRP